MKQKEENREILTDTEQVTLQRKGTSDYFLMPAHWLRTFSELKRPPYIFSAHMEKDDKGTYYIIFEKEKLGGEKPQ